MRYMERFKERFSSRPVFSITDASLFLTGLGASKGYVYLLISNLLKKGLIKKIKRGVYTFHDDPTLSGFAFSPSYHGLQDALSLLDLWDQETNTVLMTPLKVRIGKRKLLGAPVFIHRIDRRMFFGYSAIRYFDFWIQVSDVEKTLIDFVYFNEPLQPDVLEEMRKRIDREKLESYLERCPARVRKKVLSLLD